MSKDYKPRQAAPKSRSGGGFLLGLLLGFLLGLGVAAAIAIYFFKTPMPFTNKAKPPERTTPGAPGLTEAPKSGRPEDAKPRFDFYRILPGQEEQVTEQQIRQAEKTQAAAKTDSLPKDTYFLQAGAFQNPADADNLKAKLALLGMEAAVEPINLPDKGVWYRVRLGPYGRIDEINRARSQLAQDGFEAALIKVRDAPGKNEEKER